MSINRDMRKYVLQVNIPTKSPSGAKKPNWTDVEEIDVAVYKKNDFKMSTSERYMTSSHTGLTYFRDIQADRNRLVKDGVAYEITDCNPDGRLVNLLLKVVK